jgi:hypothetical protein
MCHQTRGSQGGEGLGTTSHEEQLEKLKLLHLGNRRLRRQTGAKGLFKDQEKNLQSSRSAKDEEECFMLWKSTAIKYLLAKLFTIGGRVRDGEWEFLLEEYV